MEQNIEAIIEEILQQNEGIDVAGVTEQLNQRLLEAKKQNDEAVANTLKGFRLKLASLLEEYFKECDKIKAEYQAKYFDSMDYSEQYLSGKRAELQMDLRMELEFLKGKLNDKLVKNFAKNFEPLEKEVNTDSYQLKLANVLNLLKLTGGVLPVSKMQFIIEARDVELASILANVYQTKEMYALKQMTSSEGLIKEAEGVLEMALMYAENRETTYADARTETILKAVAGE